MREQPVMYIDGRPVGPGCDVYIVAEISANHRHDFNEAVRLIEAAAEAGVDAVKLQTYTADTLTIDSRSEWFRIGKGTAWEGRTLYDLYQEACTPWEWQPGLKERTKELGMHLFSSPFDASAVDFLEKMEVPAYKIASFESVDLPLLKRVAATGKPVILSTGLSTLNEIDEAVQTWRDAGGAALALLKCTSAYPAPLDEMNLRTIPHMAERFEVPIGLSDHTLGNVSAIAAVALGACIIEKHLTLSRAAGGPDAAFSLEPPELGALVQYVREAQRALGRVHYGVSAHERASRIFRRSLFVVEAVKAGDLFTEANVRSIRPGFGLHTRHLEDVLGRRAAVDIERGTPLSWDLIQ